jgi:hypothetical protein
MPPHKTVHPDAKGRITLGALAKGISSYEVKPGKNGQIILEPRVEIPAREAWLFQNKTALKMVLAGLEDAKAGRVRSLGSFRKYADDDID